MWIAVVLVISLAGLIYKYAIGNYDYWQKRGVSFAKPLPFIGNMKTILMQKQNAGDYFTEIYNEFPNEPYVGVYKIRQPALLLRDPDLIKEVLVKEFSSFNRNDVYTSPDDVLFPRNPFMRTDEEWRIARSQITPALTGVKLKTMFPMMDENSKKLVEFIENNKEAISVDGIDAKRALTYYTTDNFILCGFGLEGNSFDNPTDNDFVEVAKSMMIPTILLGFKDFCMFMKPAWSKFFNIRFLSKEIIDYILSTVSQTQTYREQNKIARKDFFGLISESVRAHCTNAREADIEIAAHAATFYVDGVETSANFMAFVLYELGRNEEVQMALRKEVQEVLNRHDGNLTYESIQDMEYLDCVISESLRLNTPIQIMTKLCTESFTLPKTAMNKRELLVEKGTPVIIPTCSLHCDEKYYPNSRVFNPNRFREEEKQGITKYAYIPFSEGPRMCIGKKYALLQMKIGIVRIIANFHVSVTKKTNYPHKKGPTAFFLVALGGLWLNFNKI